MNFPLKQYKGGSYHRFHKQFFRRLSVCLGTKKIQTNSPSPTPSPTQPHPYTHPNSTTPQPMPRKTGKEVASKWLPPFYRMGLNLRRIGDGNMSLYSRYSYSSVSKVFLTKKCEFLFQILLEKVRILCLRRHINQLSESRITDNDIYDIFEVE